MHGLRAWAKLPAGHTASDSIRHTYQTNPSIDRQTRTPPESAQPQSPDHPARTEALPHTKQAPPLQPAGASPHSPGQWLPPPRCSPRQTCVWHASGSRLSDDSSAQALREHSKRRKVHPCFGAIQVAHQPSSIPAQPHLESSKACATSAPPAIWVRRCWPPPAAATGSGPTRAGTCSSSACGAL